MSLARLKHVSLRTKNLHLALGSHSIYVWLIPLSFNSFWRRDILQPWSRTRRMWDASRWQRACCCHSLPFLDKPEPKQRPNVPKESPSHQSTNRSQCHRSNSGQMRRVQMERHWLISSCISADPAWWTRRREIQCQLGFHLIYPQWQPSSFRDWSFTMDQWFSNANLLLFLESLIAD